MKKTSQLGMKPSENSDGKASQSGHQDGCRSVMWYFNICYECGVVLISKKLEG